MVDKKIFAIYDILGIQNFIFSTNKLKENFGGSIIVQEAFEKDLKKIIKQKCNNPLYEINSTDIKWEEHDAIRVFYRGGNALVIFDDNNKHIEVTQELSKTIFQNSGGLLNFLVAYRKTSLEDFREDFDNLMVTLKDKKNSYVITTPQLGIGITKSELSSGLPVQYEESGDLLSGPSFLKRDKAYIQLRKEQEKYYNFLLEDNLKDRYEFPLELDELGKKTGENYIAIVHIDGDSMGQKIKNFLNKTRDNFNESIYRMSTLSGEIDRVYRKVMKKTVKVLVKALHDSDFQSNFNLRTVNNSNKKYLPIRPIILNGDDVTFVCNGKLGINLAEIFLKILSEESLEVSNETIPISASAGVAIVKTHFPFDRAYTIAEELCRSAKIKGKILQEQYKEKTNKLESRGFWLDFHIVQTGFTSDLSETRETQYNIAGLPNPDPLTTVESKINYSQHNLLWRPWLIIGGNHLSQYDWSNLKDILNWFHSPDKKEKWPNSKLKKLSQLLTTSVENVQEFLLRMESRDTRLPEFLGTNDIFPIDNMTPYFDILEMLDFYYIEMEELKK